MKKILALVSFLLVVAACTTQPSTNTNTASNTNSATAKSAAPSADEMFAKEKAAWDTLKQKDYDAFGNMLASDYIEVTDEGVIVYERPAGVYKDPDEGWTVASHQPDQQQGSGQSSPRDNKDKDPFH